MGQLFSVSPHQAAFHGDLAGLRRLVKRKSSRSSQKSVSLDNLECGKTALFLAVTAGRYEAVALLLVAGADPNALCVVERNTWSFQWSALHEAASLGNAAIVKLLLKKGGNVNLEAHHQMSPLHIASWFSHRNIIKLLVEAGCDVNMLDRFQESALVIPICQGDYTTVRQLLLYGCKLNSRCWANVRKIRGKYETEFRESIYTRQGPFSLFSLAIKYSWLDIARLLLRHGFNPNKYQLLDILQAIKRSMGAIETSGRCLIQCFLAAGYRIKAADETEIVRLAELGEKSRDGGGGGGGGGSRDGSKGGRPAVAAAASAADVRPNGFSDGFVQWLLSQSGIREPLSLADLTRCALRAHLRVCTAQASVQPAVERLALPRVLHDYVLMAEYSDERDRLEEAAAEGEEEGDPGALLLDRTAMRDPLFAMPRRLRARNGHIRQFWAESCCCNK